MKSVIIIILFAALSAAWAGQECEPAITKENAEGLLQETRDRFFPELKSTRIRLDLFRSHAYFLQAQPIAKTLLKPRQHRRYHVQINQRLLDCPPSLDALQAIMVHELEHVVDYTHWNSARLLRHGIRYSTSLSQRIRYERATDQKVLLKGLHEGLAQYREWVYQWLTPKELAAKRKIYLTPEEIRSDEAADQDELLSELH